MLPAHGFLACFVDGAGAACFLLMNAMPARTCHVMIGPPSAPDVITSSDSGRAQLANDSPLRYSTTASARKSVPLASRNTGSLKLTRVPPHPTRPPSIRFSATSFVQLPDTSNVPCDASLLP